MNRFVKPFLFAIAVLGIGVAVVSLRDQPESNTAVMQIIPTLEGESIIVNPPDSISPVTQIIPTADGKSVIIGQPHAATPVMQIDAN